MLIVVSFFTFLLIRLLPGDPTDDDHPVRHHGAEAAAPARTSVSRSGFFQQYWDYVSGLAQGDLGHQYSSGRPVSDLVEQSLPVSLQLMIYAQIIALFFAIPLGIFAAYRIGTRSDRAINTTGVRIPCPPELRAGAAALVLHRRRAQMATDLRLRAGLARSDLRPEPHS